MMLMVHGKDIFNVHWPNSLGLIEGFCTVCEQPWVDLNPRPFAQKATTLTTAPRRPHDNFYSSPDDSNAALLNRCTATAIFVDIGIAESKFNVTPLSDGF